MTAGKESLLAFYVVVFANGERQKDAELKAARMVAASVRGKDGVIPDAGTACAVSEVYELKHGHYVDEGVEDFAFFDQQEDALSTSWRGRMWEKIDTWKTRSRLRRAGLIGLAKETSEALQIWPGTNEPRGQAGMALS
ncbi:MAG: hypothetical protein ACREIA_09155 [Opitutaceae bacterium]